MRIEHETASKKKRTLNDMVSLCDCVVAFTRVCTVRSKSPANFCHRALFHESGSSCPVSARLAYNMRR